MLFIARGDFQMVPPPDPEQQVSLAEAVAEAVEKATEKDYKQKGGNTD
jgi:hypothetical protein